MTIIAPWEHEMEMIRKATYQLLSHTCPLHIADYGRRTMQVAGSAVPFQAGNRAFLITAAHVVDRLNKQSLYFPTNREASPRGKFSDDYESVTATILPKSGDRNEDESDSAFLEIDPDRLYNDFRFLPHNRVNRNLILKHVERVALIGYPTTRNENRPHERNVKRRSLCCDLESVPFDEYERLGLDPLIHFCVRYNIKRVRHLNGQIGKGNDLDGMSGGAAWTIDSQARLTGDPQGMMLIGIISEHNKAEKVVWGPNITGIMMGLADKFSDVANFIPQPLRRRTTDPDEIKLWQRHLGA